MSINPLDLATPIKLCDGAGCVIGLVGTYLNIIGCADGAAFTQFETNPCVGSGDGMRVAHGITGGL